MTINEQFAGKVVLITGAGKGTGRAVAEAFGKQAAIVAVNDISPLNVEEVAARINAEGGQAKVYLHDIAKKVDAQALINEIIDDYGRIDILVNCANVKPHGPLLDMDEWDLHRVFEVNAIGTFVMIQSVGRVMRAQGGGIIVSSVRFPEEQGLAAYAASRLAVAGLTERAAAELGQYQIRVYAVTSGLPYLNNTVGSYQNPKDAVLAFCSEKFDGENGSMINVG